MVRKKSKRCRLIRKRDIIKMSKTQRGRNRLSRCGIPIKKKK